MQSCLAPTTACSDHSTHTLKARISGLRPATRSNLSRRILALIILPGVEYLPKLATSDFGFSVCWFYGCLFVFTTFNFALSALSILVPLHTRMFCYPNGTYSFLAPRRKIYTLKFEKSLKNNDEFIGKIQKNSAVQQWLQAMRFRAHRAARI